MRFNLIWPTLMMLAFGLIQPLAATAIPMTGIANGGLAHDGGLPAPYGWVYADSTCVTPANGGMTITAIYPNYSSHDPNPSHPYDQEFLMASGAGRTVGGFTKEHPNGFVGLNWVFPPGERVAIKSNDRIVTIEGTASNNPDLAFMPLTCTGNAVRFSQLKSHLKGQKPAPYKPYKPQR
jgi:hypothetical protein